MNLLAGKRLLITGVVTRGSIAHAAASRALELGAEVVLTAFPRDRHLTEDALGSLPSRPPVLELDLTEPAQVAEVTQEVASRFGPVDGALHAVAFAPRRLLGGDFLAAEAADVELAFRTSAHSYAALALMLRDLAEGRGGAMVGLDFDAAGAWPVYDWMGVCKAALESTNRYLARDLGPLGIRANLVAAGPLHTRAAGGIPEFERLTEAWDRGAPLEWNPYDPTPVADATCFLLSDLARQITGEIVHVDGGYHAMAAPLR